MEGTNKNPAHEIGQIALCSTRAAEQEMQEQVDPCYNFASPEFDAAAALQVPDLQLPVPEAPVLDNVSKFATILAAATATDTKAPEPPSLSQQRSSEAKKAKAAALKQRARAVAQRAEASVKVGSLQTIMAIAAVGPLAVLAKWQAQFQRVYVVTRHAGGIRGRAVGTLVGFDRFLNLLLRDVDESYTVIVKVQRVKQQQPQQIQATSTPLEDTSDKQDQQLTNVQASSSPINKAQQQQHQQPLPQDSSSTARSQQGQPSGRTRTRWCRQQQHRYRKLDQILVKGDNIVLVSGTPPALTLPGAAPAAATAAASSGKPL